jgi:uroporphyrinogen III methyltransferase/synthase
VRGRPFPVELKGIRFASIGPVTSATLRELGLPVDIEAREFTIAGLLQAILGN